MRCVEWRPTRGVNCLLDQICLNRTVEPPVLRVKQLKLLGCRRVRKPRWDTADAEREQIDLNGSPSLIDLSWSLWTFSPYNHESRIAFFVTTILFYLFCVLNVDHFVHFVA